MFTVLDDVVVELTCVVFDVGWSNSQNDLVGLQLLLRWQTEQLGSIVRNSFGIGTEGPKGQSVCKHYEEPILYLFEGSQSPTSSCALQYGEFLLSSSPWQ